MTITIDSKDFPIDLSTFRRIALDPKVTSLTDQQLDDLKFNIQLIRDAIVLFTAVADGKGLGGHTGGPYDTVPETMIAYAFIEHARQSGEDNIVPIFFDEAGHRVATQYIMSVLEGDMPAEKLMHYREYLSHLPGHPERGFTPGVKFSSGRLGHMWPMVNGVSIANPGKVTFMLGSDGSQMEGNDAEAARLCVAQNLNVKLILDDNDVTIADHPSNYMPGYDVAKTLAGHGMKICIGDGEDIPSLYTRMATAFTTDGPIALINKRPMAPGIEGIEGSCHGHDVIKVATAISYLEKRGLGEAAKALQNLDKGPAKPEYKGSTGSGKNRSAFGKVVNSILEKMTKEQRIEAVRVFDCDLEGSCGLDAIHKAYPEIFIPAGIMERGNFAAAAGFGFEKGKQGIFGTFSAFLEMIISEVTMARLNNSNVLAHFSHAGCDDMADNTCHFGINNLYAANGLPDEGKDTTRVYFPADQHQFAKCITTMFNDPGLRFIFSTRSAVPDILDDNGNLLFGDGYDFQVGKDDIIREGTAGYIVSFGDTLYRALDAVIKLKEQGIDVGLINKSTLNVMDEEMMVKLSDAPAILVAESFNVNTGLGSKFGTELLKRGFGGYYNNIGINREGSGGLWQQHGFQGIDTEGIQESFKLLLEV